MIIMRPKSDVEEDLKDSGQEQGHNYSSEDHAISQHTRVIKLKDPSLHALCGVPKLGDAQAEMISS